MNSEVFFFFKRVNYQKFVFKILFVLCHFFFLKLLEKDWAKSFT